MILLLFFMSKKGKKPWEVSLVETKLLKGKRLLMKKICQVKTHLKPTDFSLLWKLTNLHDYLYSHHVFMQRQWAVYRGRSTLFTIFLHRGNWRTLVVSQTEVRKDLISHFTPILFLRAGICEWAYLTWHVLSDLFIFSGYNFYLVVNYCEKVLTC